MAAGRLLWFSTERGYGLVQPDIGGPPRLVTREDLPCPTRLRLAQDRNVATPRIPPVRVDQVSARASA